MTHEETRQLDRIEEAILEIREYLAGQREREATLTSDVARLRQTIDGNGRPGLVVRVDRIEHARRLNWAWIAGTAGVLCTAIGWLIGLLS